MNHSRATIVRLTGAGPGAIAVFAVAGEGARAVIGKLARHGRAGELRPGEALWTTIINPADGQPVDDGLAVCVAQDRFEIHVHGGVAVGESLMKAAVAAGGVVGDVMAIAASPLVAEVEGSLPKAVTLTAARLLAAQVDEGLGLFVRQWAEAMRSENPPALWKFQSAAQWVLGRSARLMRLLTGARIVVLGLPNAGKSTLVNALLGRQAAITSEMAGTTRDWVEGETIFAAPASGGGDAVAATVVLVDTAGVRETADVLEEISIRRTHEQAGGGDLILVVLDSSREMAAEERALLETYPQALVALNKMDIAGGSIAGIPGAVRVSALRREGLDALMVAALQRLDLAEISVEEPFCFTDRQRELLHAAALAESAAVAQELLLAMSLRVG